MTKLTKGLTLAAGGVPAAAILTACVMNAAPNAGASTETVHTDNVAAETEAPPKPPAAAPYAMVQPRSLAPPGHDPRATPHKDAAPRTQTVPDPQASPGAVLPDQHLAAAIAPDAAAVPDQGPAYVPTGPSTGPGTGAPPPVASRPPAPRTTDRKPAQGDTATPPADRTHPVQHRRHPVAHRTDPAQRTDRATGRGTPDAAAPGTPLDMITKHAATPRTTVEDVKKKLGTKVVAYARAQLGKPYVFGAEGPRAFDCSGLVQAAYKSAGINMPRTSDAQYWFGKRVHAGQERPGDLVFFDYKPGHSGPGHVGIVMDPAKGLMIVAPHTGDHVKIQSYTRYPGGPTGFTRPLDRPDMQHKLARLAK
jgi:cell wall-associated NlpC family hydrolase